MPADTEQPGDDEQGERPRRRRSRDDDDSSNEQAVKAGLNVFSRKPMETMMAIIVLGVGAQMYFNNQQQAAREAADAARYDKIVAERKEEREHDAREREKDRDAAEKRLQEVLVSGKDQNQRLVDHLKFLSDAFTKLTNQQTLNLGFDPYKAGLEIKRLRQSESVTPEIPKKQEITDANLHPPGM